MIPLLHKISQTMIMSLLQLNMNIVAMDALFANEFKNAIRRAQDGGFFPNEIYLHVKKKTKLISAKYAISYKITHGKDIEICRTIEAHLQSLDVPQDLKRPFCGVSLPRDPEFKRIDWTTLDVTQHPNVIRMVAIEKNIRKIQKLSEDDKAKAREILWNHVKERFFNKVNQGHFLLQKSRFDLDNNGAEETVYRITDLSKNVCVPSNISNSAYIWSLFVDPKDNQKLSEKLTLLTIRGDPFIWKGKTYVYIYNELPLFFHIMEPSWVNVTGGISRNLVCQYRR